MAGAKETPRQKMIGMMYLVLTALLALQIKDKVLDKFVLIEEGLETSNAVYAQSNSQSVAAIDKAYQDLGSSENDLPVLQAAQKIRQETQVIVAYLEEWKERVGEESGGKDADDTYARSTLKKYEEPSLLLVERKGADTLKTRLNDYTNNVMTTANTVLSEKGGRSLNWQPLALDAAEIELYANDPDEKSKDFAHLNFYKTPLASVLAQLTFYQNQIYAREAEALSALGGTIGASNIKGFDQISATVLPVSSIVTAGTEYEAEMFLTVSSSSIVPEMTRNGQRLEVDPSTGRGKIKFRATANNYDASGLSKQRFSGEIVFNNGGEMQTIEVQQEYTVARPSIEVTSEAIETLYLNSANKLKINVPTLGPAYNPTFTAQGGTTIKGEQKEDVTVIPSAGEVVIGVSSSGIKIGDKTFKVEPVPRPSLSVMPDNRAYDATKGLGQAPRTLTLRLVPDENFAKKFPEDARFVVSKGRVLLAAGTNAKRTIPINTPQVRALDLSSLRALARSGDRIVVSIDEITRINYANEREVIPFQRDVTLNIN